MTMEIEVDVATQSGPAAVDIRNLLHGTFPIYT